MRLPYKMKGDGSLLVIEGTCGRIEHEYEHEHDYEGETPMERGLLSKTRINPFLTREPPLLHRFA
jgi:hypothetical protein